MSKKTKNTPERNVAAGPRPTVTNQQAPRPPLDANGRGDAARPARLRGWRPFACVAVLLGVGLVAGLKHPGGEATGQAAPVAQASPPPLAKEYIYAGGKLLAVEDAGANPSPVADLAVWRPSSGYWWVQGGPGSQQVAQGWGTAGDVPVPGDYDGDGRTDFCGFRPSDNNWYLINSGDGSTSQTSFGAAGDTPAPADYDGDGRTDLAVFRPPAQTWHVRHSSTGAVASTQFGLGSDTPAPADYDGDGRADLAVFRDGAATFYSLNSGDGQVQSTAFGAPGDAPVCADYDGDGRADLAVWRAGAAAWHVRQSSDGRVVSYQLGVPTDVPVPNDYDGDGRADVALWRAAASTPKAGDVGNWYIRKSADGSLRTDHWGMADDIPVPTFYRR